MDILLLFSGFIFAFAVILVYEVHLRKLNKNVKGHLKYKSYFDRKSGIFSYVEIEDTRVKEDKNIEEILECRND